MKYIGVYGNTANKIVVSCHKLLKTYSHSVIFKDRLKRYAFESLKLRAKLYCVKTFDTIYTFSRHFRSGYIKQTKNL